MKQTAYQLYNTRDKDFSFGASVQTMIKFSLSPLLFMFIKVVDWIGFMVVIY